MDFSFMQDLWWVPLLGFACGGLVTLALLVGLVLLVLRLAKPRQRP